MKIRGKLFKLLWGVADILIVAAAYLLAMYFIKDKLPSNAEELLNFEYTVASAAGVYVIALCTVGGYSTLWRYAGLREYLMCAGACFVSFVILSVASLFARNILYALGFHVFAFAIIVLGCISVRILPRISLHISRKREDAKSGNKIAKRVNLLVIGAGAAAKKVIDDIRITEPKYRIIGVIDDDKSKIGKKVFGTRVLGTRDDIITICRENKVREILLAIPSISSADKKIILDICNKTSCKVRMLPSLSEMINTDNFNKVVRDIQIEDLLEREPISLDTTKISDYIQDKVILVTGGGGSIGSELCRQIARFKPKKLYILDVYENNAYDLENELKTKYPDLPFEIIIASVRDMDRMDSIFEKFRPEIVFHAAAHKHVPLMEINPSEAIKNNVLGTFKTAICAHKYRAKRFVLISTDKAVNPTNIMGATKRVAEMIIQSMDRMSKTEFVAVRFGNVLGSNGSVVPLFKKQIENGGPVTLTHKEITRFFMTIPEASLLVLEAASFAKGGEIFVLDMGEPVKIYDLAVNLIRLSGLEPDVDIKIETIGLRDGEKLYEELLLAEEGLRETFNKKIFVAAPMSFDWNELNARLESLYDAAANLDEDEIKSILKQIVPTYHSPDMEQNDDDECDEETDI